MASIKQWDLPEGILCIAGTVNDSIVDGEGYRYTIFTQGCPHDCPGCHNPQTHAFSGGKQVKARVLLEEIMGNPLLEGVTFSGGEPFCQAGTLVALAKELHSRDLNVWCYSGYTFEELISCETAEVQELLRSIDVLVDGAYVEAQRDLTLSFRGSSNQRVLDVQESIEQGRAVEYSLTDE